jgi:hypothetical protein
MRSVRVRVPAAEFSGAMMTIAEWLDANGYDPPGTNTPTAKMLSL